MNTMPMIRGFIILAVVGGLAFACSVDPGDCLSFGTCECRTEKDCPTGKYCVDGRCQDLIGPAVLREFGEACAFDAQCRSGICLPPGPGNGGVCTRECGATCPDGWDCRTRWGTGADPVDVCLQHIEPRLCEACAVDGQCNAAGDLCLAIGTLRACALDCRRDPCPPGSECRDVPLAAGTARQCLPLAESCECSEATRGLTRACQIRNAHGTCRGRQTCDGSPPDWTDCDAVEPAVEMCDGADNDCDGLTDVLGIDPSDPCRVQAICVGGVPVDCPAAVGPTVAPSIIDSQALWCAAGSPYLVESSLVVTEQGSLTVGPCVEVRVGDGAAIFVNGALRVLAESGRPAVFTSSSTTPRRGSWLGIEVREFPSASVKLSGAVVEYADCGFRSHSAKDDMVVCDSVFRENLVGLEGKVENSDLPSPIVKDTVFSDNDCGARAAKFDFYRAIFSGNHIALGNWYHNSSNYLFRCTISNNTVGIDNPAGRIVKCLIAGNTEAGFMPLYGHGMPYQITGCTIEGNGIGIVHNIQIGFDRFPEIKNSKLCQNLQYDIKVETWHPLDATGNYWCTTDPDEIAARIYDIHEDASLGEVVFVPFLERAP